YWAPSAWRGARPGFPARTASSGRTAASRCWGPSGRPRWGLATYSSSPPPAAAGTAEKCSRKGYHRPSRTLLDEAVSMATGWAGDGAVQDQIDATVKDGILRAKSRLPQGPSLTHCAECGA